MKCLAYLTICPIVTVTVIFMCLESVQTLRLDQSFRICKSMQIPCFLSLRDSWGVYTTQPDEAINNDYSRNNFDAKFP